MPLDSTFHEAPLPRAEEARDVELQTLLTEVRRYSSRFTLDHSQFLGWFETRVRELVAVYGSPHQTTVSRKEADRWIRAFRIILEREYVPRGKPRPA